jgi:hypothetical protein
MTVEENLLLGAYIRPRSAELAKLAEEVERVYLTFPMLREGRRKRAADLSGGQQQMLEMARALLLRPRLRRCRGLLMSTQTSPSTTNSPCRFFSMPRTLGLAAEWRTTPASERDINARAPRERKVPAAALIGQEPSRGSGCVGTRSPGQYPPAS